jgi:hypothetical protein
MTVLSGLDVRHRNDARMRFHWQLRLAGERSELSVEAQTSVAPWIGSQRWNRSAIRGPTCRFEPSSSTRPRRRHCA